jgi:hypothetical protein
MFTFDLGVNEKRKVNMNCIDGKALTLMWSSGDKRGWEHQENK